MPVARVSHETRARYTVVHEGRAYQATLRGHFHDTQSPSNFPKVGDYVEVELIDAAQAIITNVRERHNALTRVHPHTGEAQVMVANIDYVWIVVGGTEDLNVARLERYVALARQSDATPVLVINKVDQIDQPAAVAATLSEHFPSLATYFISATQETGISALAASVPDGATIALLGASGAGKSSIMNALVPAATQTVQAVRAADGRGRHTTTTRQMFMLPNGACIIDTPGMRELTLVDQADVAATAYADIQALASQCRFTDCDHDRSAGCALTAAVAKGELSKKRWRSYLHFISNQERHRRIRTNRS